MKDREKINRLKELAVKEDPFLHASGWYLERFDSVTERGLIRDSDLNDALAETINDDSSHIAKYIAAADPKTVLSIIEENEKLKDCKKEIDKLRRVMTQMLHNCKTDKQFRTAISIALSQSKNEMMDMLNEAFGKDTEQSRKDYFKKLKDEEKEWTPIGDREHCSHVDPYDDCQVCKVYYPEDGEDE